jgi:tRNA (pseudouridine54-N1)-methyltransferase
MRTFVVVGHDAPTTPEFSLDDLPGAGRLDVLCRCLTSAFLLSHGIRETVEVRLVLADAFTLRFDGATLERLNPDERSTAARIRNALDERAEAVGHIPVETSPGVSIRRVGFEQTIADVGGTVCHLHATGTPATAVEPPADPVFVLSDHHDFQRAEVSALASARDHQISLGPEALHADQAITVAHNWLDTDGFELC